MQNDYKESNFCNFLVHWTQTDPICWFNALLMATLFSQRSRKKIIQTMVDTWKEVNIQKYKTYIPKNVQISHNIQIFDAIYNIMMYLTHRRNLKSKLMLYQNDVDFFRHYNSVQILQLLHYFNPNMFPINKPVGSISQLYIKKFYDILGVNSIIFDRIENNQLVYSFYNDTQVLTNKHFIENYLNKIDLQKRLNKDIDIIMINISSVKFNYPDYYHVGILESLQDIIIYNDDEYELDSILLVNWNKSKYGSHGIAGITCDKQRFVYNGWYSGTKDPTMQSYERSDHTDTHCQLMKFHWDANVDMSFHLDPVACQLISQQHDKHRLLFSFAKGDRILIYVKKPTREQLQKQYNLERQLVERQKELVAKLESEDMLIEGGLKRYTNGKKSNRKAY